jgi:hypothetical protein
MKNNYFQFPDLPDHNALISVKAGAGQGKTKAMIQKIRRTNKKAHVIGYGCGNEMLMQTVRRAKEAGVTIYLLNNEDSVVSLAVRKSANLAYRVSSITEVEGCFAGKDVYIEESCSVLKYIFEGIPSGEKKAERIYAEDEQDERPDLSNERKHLAEVVRVLTAAMVEADRVFLLDANNSDLYTKFFHSLCPNKQLIKIEDTCIAPKRNIKIVDAITDGETGVKDRSPETEIMLSRDVFPWIYFDSEIQGKIIEQMLEGADRNTSYIMVSSIVESGFCTNISNCFTHNFSTFAGVAGTNEQMQGMFRLRDNLIPHIVFCPERSDVSVRNSPGAYHHQMYLKVASYKTEEGMELSYQIAKEPERAFHFIYEVMLRNDPKWWQASEQLRMLDNYEMNNLRKCLIYALKEAGHSVEIVRPDGYKGAEESEQTAKSVVDWDRWTQSRVFTPTP